MTTTIAPVQFAQDPIASHSAQFPLTRPFDQRSADCLPSSPESRPWNLRTMHEPTGAGVPLPEFHYDHQQQVAVTPDGRSLVEAYDPTANSVTDNDGDEGRSEDWSYDFAPDSPFPA